MRCLWRQTRTDAPVAAFFFFLSIQLLEVKKKGMLSPFYIIINLNVFAFCTVT